MADRSDGIQYAGEYILKEASLVTSTGAQIDMKGTIFSYSIFESLFSTSLSGSFMFLDIDNIVTNGPIIGQEYLYLKIGTPGLDEYDFDFTNVPFTTYKVNIREDVNPNTQVIEVKFTSPEIIRNSRTRVSKSYAETIDKIVENILRDERYINTAKDLYIESTSGIRKVISPNLHPYDFITNLATEAVSSKDGNPFFMFYENVRGINFKSIESMFSQDTVGNYSLGDFGNNDVQKRPDVQKEFGRILDFQIAGNSDMLSNVLSGVLGSSIIEYNIYNKFFNKSTYSYIDDFDKFPRINYDNKENDNPIYSESPIDDKGNTVGSFTDARIHLHPVSSGGNFDTQHTNPTSSYNYQPNNIKNSLLHRQAKFNEITNGVAVKMVINGSTNITVGETINVTIPVTGREHDREYDKYYTGKYLIRNIAHTFDITSKKHQSILVASKDSFYDGVPEGSNIPEETKQLTNTINY
tara:strand:- start:230 stop:1630 length:1401 start_codon:yes stop_codon:yes gene_type:complete